VVKHKFINQKYAFKTMKDNYKQLRGRIVVTTFYSTEDKESIYVGFLKRSDPTSIILSPYATVIKSINLKVSIRKAAESINVARRGKKELERLVMEGMLGEFIILEKHDLRGTRPITSLDMLKQ